MEIKTLEDAQKKDGLKIFLYGASGTGKTSVARSFGKVLLISPESGHKSLLNPKAMNDIDIIEPRDIDEFRESYAMIKNSEKKYDTVMIDSVTELSQMLLKNIKDEYSEKQALKMWGEIAVRTINILKSFRNLENINVVLTALEKNSKVGLVDYVVPMFEGQKAGDISPALFDIVARIVKSKEGKREIVIDAQDSVGKDRYNIINNGEVLDMFDPFGSILKHIGKNYLEQQLGNKYEKEKEKFYSYIKSIRKENEEEKTK